MRLKHTSFVLVLTTTALLLLSCQSKTSENEIQALQKQLTEQKELLEKINKDVEGIKKVVEGVRGPAQEDQARLVSTDDDYIKGRPDAKITLIEFSDFQCPFCARFYRETLPLIDKEYIRTGKVRMVYRDFPIDNIHKDAEKAAEATQCAGEQGKFWEMHDKLFENQKALTVNHLKRYAKELGLSVDRFNQCLDSGKYAQEVQKDLMDGQEAGVAGTPTFFVGYTGKDNTIQGKPIRGARPFETFKQVIDGMLEPQGRTSAESGS